MQLPLLESDQPSPPASGLMANVNGVEIDLMPTEGMREEAQRYRDWKADGEGGGTDVARTRASQILSGNELSPDTVVTMSAWFARHEVDKQGKGFSPGEDGYPSNGRVAWAAWGGDPGKSWSDARSKRIKKAREGRQLISNNEEELLTSMEQEQERAAPDALKTGDFVSWNSPGGRARRSRSLVSSVMVKSTCLAARSSSTALQRILLH